MTWGAGSFLLRVQALGFQPAFPPATGFFSAADLLGIGQLCCLCCSGWTMGLHAVGHVVMHRGLGAWWHSRISQWQVEELLGRHHLQKLSDIGRVADNMCVPAP